MKSHWDVGVSGVFFGRPWWERGSVFFIETDTVYRPTELTTW